MPKKKVLFVTNTMGQAGAENAMVELMKALQDECEISLFSLIPRGEVYGRLPEGVRVLNRRCSTGLVMTGAGRLFIACTLLGCFFRHGAGFRCAGEMMRILFRQLREGKLRPEKIFWRLLAEGAPRLDEKFDLAIASLEGAAAYYVAARVRAPRKAGFIHIEYDQAGYSAEIDHGCYELFDAVFPVSEGVRNAFLREYPQLRNRVHLFDNLLDEERIKTLAENGKGFSDGFCPFRILTVARLHPQKALDVSVRAAALLRDRGLDFRWYVAGEGGERASLEKLIRKLKLKERFILLGFVENPYPLLKQADVYVHATDYEGKSIAIAEAKILKRPIIASDIPGNREQIVSGKNGLLVRLEASVIADAILQLARDPMMQKRFSEAPGLESSMYSDGIDRLKSLLRE